MIEFEGLDGNLNASTPYNDAMAKCRIIEQTALRIGDLIKAAIAKRSIAECCRRVGRIQEAQNELNASLDIFKLINEPQEIARTLWFRSNLSRQLGNLKDCLQDLYWAQNLLRSHMDRKLNSYIAAGVAEVCRIMGLYPIALKQHYYAARFFQKMNDYRGVVWSMQGIAQIHMQSCNLRTAAQHFENSIRVASEIGDQRALGWGYRGLGEVYRMARCSTMARNNLSRAKQFFAVTRCDVGMGYTYRSLGDLERSVSNEELAIMQYRVALSIFEQTKDVRGSSFVAQSISKSLYNIQHRDHSIEVARSALRWFHQNEILLGFQKTSNHLIGLSINPRSEISTSKRVEGEEILQACLLALEN